MSAAPSQLEPNKGGRPSHEPTTAQRKQVEAMAAYGIPQMDISRVIGVSKPTLEKHYRDELDTGATKATARVAESLYKKATGDGNASVTAAIFWLKTRAGWKETTVSQHTGRDGGPIEYANMTEAEVDARLAALAGDHQSPSDEGEA